MLQAGDVVVVDFPGATGTKRRPAVVLSTSLYHQHRPDVIVGLLTTQIAVATCPTDHVLLDWSEAGLHAASAFRTYVVTLGRDAVTRIGHLSERDLQAVQECLKRGMTTSPGSPLPQDC